MALSLEKDLHSVCLRKSVSERLQPVSYYEVVKAGLSEISQGIVTPDVEGYAS